MQENFLGIDIGSAASKCVVIDESGMTIGRGIFPSGAGTPGPDKCLEQALDQAGIGIEDVTASCATGYGRKLATWTTHQVSELTCHAKGAAATFEGVRTVIDIGGQDAKVLSLDECEGLSTFVMNEKCAAGTGRFLEVMARVFGCEVSDLSSYDAQADKPVSISSTCVVFAESEVISKLASGEPVPGIVAGVHESVASRTFGLAQRIGIEPPVAMTGGVALNEALRKRLEQRIGYPIQTNPQSQYIGALGAALIARDRYCTPKTT